MHAEATKVLVWASLLSVVLAISLSVLQGLMTLKVSCLEFGDADLPFPLSIGGFKFEVVFGVGRAALTLSYVESKR